jgi:hypothetical protein
MKSNIPKKSLFLFTIIFGIVLSLFLYLYREINNKNQESELRETEWQTEAARRDDIKALDNSIKIIEAERAQLETHFARSSDIVPLLDTIENLAAQANTKAEVLSVDVVGDQSGLSVGVKASGNFADLYKFLTLLENSPYELEIASLDLQKVPEANVTAIKTLPWDAIFKIKLLSFVP